MQEIKIIKVKTRAERKLFVEFPLKLYKDCPQFVPPLYSDEMVIFTDKNAYADTCRSEFFLAMRGGEVVGRIQGIIQTQHNELHNERRVRFTRFDAIDDIAVAKALFAALEGWAGEEGMDTVCGPLGYSDLEREGLLIEGFEYLSTFEEQYNYEYYAALIEGCGYSKEVDWLEFMLRAPENPNPMLAKVAARALELNKLHVVDHTKYSKRAYIDRYKDRVFDCIDRCYSHLYGTVPFTESMKKQLVDQFMAILNKKYLIIIADEEDNPVAFALCFPSFGEALKKSGGRLTIPALFRMFSMINKPKVIDLGLIAILPEYQASGLTAVMLNAMMEFLKSGEIDHFETNLNLESNTAVISQWKYFDATQHKRRRSYIKKLN